MRKYFKLLNAVRKSMENFDEEAITLLIIAYETYAEMTIRNDLKKMSRAELQKLHKKSLLKLTEKFNELLDALDIEKIIQELKDEQKEI